MIKIKLHRLFLIIPLCALTLICLFFVLIPFTVSIYAIKSANSEVGATPPNAKQVSFVTEDNIKLQGWYVLPQNGKVIILVHGSGNSRENMRPYIEFLTEHEYGVLAFDMRGHGESEGKTNRFGWESDKDIKAAVNFLKDKEVSGIGALGLSLGAESLLASAKDNPDIKSIVAEGATYRSYNEFLDYPRGNGFLNKVSSTYVVDKFVQLLSSQTPPEVTITDSLRQSQTNFFFISAKKEREEIRYNQFFQKTTQKDSYLWEIDCKHTKGLSTNPDEYKQKVLDFFEQSLMIES